METINIGRRRYSDPDVLSLIRETGALVDPRSSVVSQARRLNALYRNLGGATPDPFHRLCILASLRGFEVLPMASATFGSESKDAAIVLSNKSGAKRGQIFYNPSRPPGRINFSIAHEIIHTFFPSTQTGARFRSVCSSASREANELERLCDYGASEMLMPIDEFRNAVGTFGLSCVTRVMETFGSSFEATVFRLATANPGIAAAGMVQYRLKVGEDRELQSWLVRSAQQKLLFDLGGEKPPGFKRKYRRQSFFSSENFETAHVVQWNKSFCEESCVNQALIPNVIAVGLEPLPSPGCPQGRMEAILAPYQREDSAADHPDVLFFWKSDE